MERVKALLAGDDEAREAARKLGGLLLGAGLVVVFFRRANAAFGDPWGDFALFLVLLIPFVFLYGSGMVATLATGRARPWEAVYIVFGILLLPFVFLQFLEWVGADTGAPLNLAWIFLLTAVAGAAATFVARVRFGLLLGALALIISWLALWDEILSDGIFGDVGTFRGLLLVVAALLVALAFALRFTDYAELALERAGELVTAAGIAAVVAGAISFTSVFAQIPFVEAPIAEASLFWDLVLLIVSLALIGFGTRFGTRGPAYVGAVGLIVFIYVVGLDLDDESPAGKIVGWPLVLIVLGALAFIASFVPSDRLRALRGREAATEPPPPPPPPAPPPPSP